MTDIISMITSFLSAAVRQAAPLSLAGLGVAYAEKAGILNIGEEGIMLAGAFTGFIAGYFTQNIYLGIIAGALGGVMISLIHAFISIKCKANQTISGLALNFFTLGLTSFLFLLAFGQGSSLPSMQSLRAIRIPILSSIPIIGDSFFNQNILVYILYISIAAFSIVFYKTEWGITLTAVGENPRAADTAGINVFRSRYIACIINGIFGGLGGAYITLGQLGYFQEDIVSGKGYIALVVVILGRHNPLFIFISAMIIGFASSLQFTLQAIGVPLPSQAFTMLPYVIAVLVLFFSVGKSSAPSSLGIAYDRNRR